MKTQKLLDEKSNKNITIFSQHECARTRAFHEVSKRMFFIPSLARTNIFRLMSFRRCIHPAVINTRNEKKKQKKILTRKNIINRAGNRRGSLVQHETHRGRPVGTDDCVSTFGVTLRVQRRDQRAFARDVWIVGTRRYFFPSKYRYDPLSRPGGTRRRSTVDKHFVTNAFRAEYTEYDQVTSFNAFVFFISEVLPEACEPPAYYVSVHGP